MNVRELLIRVGFDAGDADNDLDQIDGKVDKLKENFLSLGAILGALFAGGVLKSLVDTADAMQNLQAQVGNATGDMAGANAKFNELAQHANDTRSELDAYVGTWAKMNQGISAFGGSAEDTTKMVDTLSAAFAVNGTEQESASAALFQLGQTMQSGVVQGEEMNSFLDAQGTLAREVMIAIAGTVPAYKKMQAAGKVTAKDLMEAINKQYPKYMEQLKTMPMTIGSVWTMVTNDVKLAINNLNDSTKAIPKAAKFLMDAWDNLKKTVKELVEELGGLDEALIHLARVAAPLGILLGVLMGFKALAMLTSPIGIITSLAFAIGLLYDDYMTWKEGGESLIDWSDWEGPINDTIDAVKELGGEFKQLALDIAELLNIDLKNWSLKGELNDLSKHMRELVEMGNHLADLFNALSTRDWGKVKSSFKSLMEQGQGKPDALPAVTANAQKFFEPEKPKLVTKRPSWWPEWLGGPGAPRSQANLEAATSPLVPGNVPSRTVSSTVNAPVTATINITQQPGEPGEALAQRVLNGLKKPQQQVFNPHSLMMNGGAK